MNLTAFLGSPRKGGNSELLLLEALRGAEASNALITTFRLNEMDIRPCQNCGGCDESGICIIEDDMTKVYDSIRGADRIIIASPIFFFSMSAQTKIMVDRCQSFWCEKYLLKKPIPPSGFGRRGLLLLVGGMKKDIGLTSSEATGKAFFRTVNVQEHKTLCFLGVDAKAAIRSHPTALAQAFEAGKDLVKP